MENAHHLSLFWASFLICLQVYPALPASSSTVLLQLFMGGPWLLLPRGFYLSACLVTLLVGFLRVCLIQPHLRLVIWMSILSCSALAHSSSFLMTSGQWIPMMDVRHMLTKDRSLLEVVFVTLHVSEPNRRTDFMFVLNICGLVFLAHLGISITNAVVAFPILTCLSCSDPPSLLMLLPR